MSCYYVYTDYYYIINQIILNGIVWPDSFHVCSCGRCAFGDSGCSWSMMREVVGVVLFSEWRQAGMDQPLVVCACTVTWKLDRAASLTFSFLYNIYFLITRECNYYEFGLIRLRWCSFLSFSPFYFIYSCQCCFSRPFFLSFLFFLHEEKSQELCFQHWPLALAFSPCIAIAIVAILECTESCFDLVLQYGAIHGE